MTLRLGDFIGQYDREFGQKMRLGLNKIRNGKVLVETFKGQRGETRFAFYSGKTAKQRIAEKTAYFQ